MFDLGSYWPAPDNFAGGILKALLAANFKVIKHMKFQLLINTEVAQIN